MRRVLIHSSATINAVLLHDPAQVILVVGISGGGGNADTVQVASNYAVGSQDVWTNMSKQLR